MPKDNRDFFKQKKIWSEVKDELLGSYLVPYFCKLLSMRNPTVYVDCFAGKGKFDDGKNGSPLIALECLDKSILLSRNGISLPQVHMRFIELNYASELLSNLQNQPQGRCKVFNGKFEDHIRPLLQEVRSENRNANVFLYFDPYGVKALNASFFDELPLLFNTAEILINLNTFGFIREACRVMKVGFREGEDNVLEDLEEYDRSILNSYEDLNTIAGGEYWKKIMSDYSSGCIDCYQAEKVFAEQYKLRLRDSYKYVLDMPIRLKSGQQPKYRMVYATNHPDGCLLMADNIAKRADHLAVDIQSSGQLSLFDQSAENELVDEHVLEAKTRLLLESTKEYTRLNKFLADFYNEFGVLCDLSRLSSGKNGSVLKTMEKRHEILVLRDPPLTEKGSPSTFWQECKGKTLMLKRRS